LVENQASQSRNHRVSLLARLGELIVRRPRLFFVLPLVLCLVLIPLAMQATQGLTTIGWTPWESDSHQVQLEMEDEFGRATRNHFILFSDPTGSLRADNREFRLAVEKAVRPFRNDPDVAAV
jgi:uncharacterized membrane protein YdfJ with MMPL/SSD domain